MTSVDDAPSLTEARGVSRNDWRPHPARRRRAPSSTSGQLSVPRVAAAVLGLGLAVLLLNLVVFSRLQHDAAQASLRDQLRDALAKGVAPVSQTDQNGRLLAPGTPVAILRIPSLGVDEVVGEGTTSELLTRGPGHLRATVLPGEAGTSQVFGRQAAYGGPFRAIASLRPGAEILAIDGLGTFTYKVIDVRRAGDPVPPSLRANGGRLTLLTADGTPFDPSGVVRVDADLSGGKATAVALDPVTLTSSELAMAGDTSAIWQLILWLQALLVLLVLATLGWARWGRTQTWIAALPAVLLVLYFISDQTTRLLPNLL